jgi:hypothetical protein
MNKRKIANTLNWLAIILGLSVIVLIGLRILNVI